MSSNMKNLLKSLVTVNAGCGCGRPKLSDVYEPKPKSKASAPQNPKHCSSHDRNNALSAIENDDLTSTSFSFNNLDTLSSISTTLNSESEPDLPRPSKVMLSPCPKIVDSITVVKDSNDPYQDFRHSMLQMIMEKQLYSKHDLQELLQCFLELNSPCHHDVIVKAFTEIWDQLVISKEINVTVQQEEPCVVHGEKHGSSSS
ncbi:hypothetical protein PTKIN_Ptkin11bG0065000 [Pterospermum kingtungense]